MIDIKKLNIEMDEFLSKLTKKELQAWLKTDKNNMKKNKRKR